METKFAERKQEKEVLAWILRKFPEGRIPAEDAQYLIEHTEELPDMLLAMMARRTITTPAQLQVVVSDWQKLFGHLRILDSNFNESNFPLEPEAELREIVCKEFADTATGNDRLHWAESEGMEISLPRATGLYLKANPKLQLEQPVVGGGQWLGVGLVFVPVFFGIDRQPDVGFRWLDLDFSPRYVWLFSRKLGA